MSNPIDIKDFKSVEQRKKSLSKKSVKEVFSIPQIFTTFFVIVDTICLYFAWDTVMKAEDWYLVFLISVVSAIILDVPAMIIGKTAKMYSQGFASKRDLILDVAFGLCGFLIVCAFSIVLRILTKDASFVNPTVSDTVNQIGTQTMSTESSPAVIAAAIFMAVLPIGTSVIGLLIAMRWTDPLKIVIDKYENALLLASYHRASLEQIIAEEENIERKAELLIERESNAYNIICQQVKDRELVLKQAVRSAINMKLKEPEQLEEVIKSSKKMLQENPEFNSDYSSMENIILNQKDLEHEANDEDKPDNTSDSTSNSTPDSTPTSSEQ